MPERRQGPRAGEELTAQSFADAIGGVRGIIDSAVPATVFVLVRLVTGNLTTAIVVALASGLALAGLRTARGQSLQQVGSGFFGLVIAVVVARATGTGEGFFLPGIVLVAVSGVAFVVSLLLRRPAVGLALALLDPKYAGWAEHPRLFRACQLATAFWALTFFVRAVVSYSVYRMEGDNDGLLLIVVNVVKYPLIVVAALLTLFLVRRSGFQPARPAAAEDQVDRAAD